MLLLHLSHGTAQRLSQQDRQRMLLLIAHTTQATAVQLRVAAQTDQPLLLW
jgi:hypothetical protein